MSVQHLYARLNGIVGEYTLHTLAVFGVATLVVTLLKLFNALLSLFVLSGTNLRRYGPKGSWVVITGASDGIGKEFAIQFAQKGYNTLLVSRTASKLNALATEITSKFAGVQTKTLAMDFAKDSAADYKRLAELIDGLDVAVLVNNVGKSHDMPVPFLETEDAEMEDIITINVKGTLKVTKIVAPGMVARRRGLILTMGSFGGFIPTPLLATYSGSKAFLQYWSTALGAELKPHGVDTQLVIGYLITSAMSKVRKPSMMIPTPKKFVKAVLGKIGLKGTAGGMTGTMTPFWSHGVMHWAIQELFGVWNGTVLARNRNMHASIRRRALRKKEREAAGVKKAT